jgi:segregation and condensation protein B
MPDAASSWSSAGGRWHFQTAADLAHILRREREESRSSAAPRSRRSPIIAYHEPVSRAEIEAIRGVQISRGTLDVPDGSGLGAPGRPREVPGRPLTFATTQEFLSHFGLKTGATFPESTI